jgi:hemerythrin superfamily protein
VIGGADLLEDQMSEATRETAEDVIDEILRDHQEIKQLFALIDASVGDTKQDAFERLVRKLAVHETAEEEVVHPAARKQDEHTVEQRLEEENDGKSALSDLEHLGVGDPRFDAQFAKFEQEILRHAENEEQYELPKLRTAVDAKQRERMARLFRAAENTAPTHPHPNAPQSATGNMAVGPIMSIVDRTRDAIRRARGD